MKKMKKCRICNQEKPLGEFSKHPSSKDGLRGECKLKMAAYRKKYNQANPEKRAASRKKYRQANPGKDAKVIRANRDWALHQLGGGCADCDLRYDGTNSSAFDFHHVNPSEKKNKISGAFLTRSKHIIQKELDKCVILCKPDHKKRHSDFKNGHRQTL